MKNLDLNSLGINNGWRLNHCAKNDELPQLLRYTDQVYLL
jgi:hypothetical protein